MYELQKRKKASKSAPSPDDDDELRLLTAYPSMQAITGAIGVHRVILKRAKRKGCVAFRYSRVYLVDLLRFLFHPANYEVSKGYINPAAEPIMAARAEAYWAGKKVS